MQKPASPTFIERLWDLWCIISVIGIWPRFIEPKLICTSRHTIPIPELARDLSGLKVVHISDLHVSSFTSPWHLKRIRKKIAKLSPDLIVFTGDFISYGKLQEKAALEQFFSSLSAPFGVYAIFGNHDYADYVSMAKDGSYCTMTAEVPAIMRGFGRLFSAKEKSSAETQIESPVAIHEELAALLEKAGVRILHNDTVHIGTKDSWLNLTGLGDMMAGQALPSKAFRNYDMHAPGIVLSHNPDSFAQLQAYPGNLYLFGHTHGGQVNLPFLWQKITPLKDKRFKKGIFHINDRYLYVNRGLGATFPFRWFAPPEIALLTLVRKGPVKVTEKSFMWQNFFSREPAPGAACGRNNT